MSRYCRCFINFANQLTVVFTSYRTVSPPVLITIQLPLSARSEEVQFSWTQADGFQVNEEVWQLDNVALLYNEEINTPRLDNSSESQQLNFVMFYSGGNVEVKLIAT